MIYATTARPAADANWRRGPTEKIGIVVHVTEGNRASVREHFNNLNARVSAQYMVCTDGTRDQFVAEDDIAYHAGRVDQPTARIVLDRPGVNPNVYLIGIEHEGDGTKELTPKQRESSLELMADIIARRPNIKPTRYHIVGHHEIFRPKSCPGGINVDRLVAELAGIPASPAPTKPIPPRPVVVWSDYLGDWLIVTRVVSDLEWYFVPLKGVRVAVVTRGQTPLSRMPLSP